MRQSGMTRLRPVSKTEPARRMMTALVSPIAWRPAYLFPMGVVTRDSLKWMLFMALVVVS